MVGTETGQAIKLDSHDRCYSYWTPIRIIGWHGAVQVFQSVNSLITLFDSGREGIARGTLSGEADRRKDEKGTTQILRRSSQASSSALGFTKDCRFTRGVNFVKVK